MGSWSLGDFHAGHVIISRTEQRLPATAPGSDVILVRGKMAAPGARADLRVRLTFDYPPPAVPESRHLWFMLDPERCRAVTDVSAIIRERFFYSRRGTLSLYLDGCLLPPGESVRLIRDGDCISVKWGENHPHNSPHWTAKKRQRVEEETDDYRDLREVTPTKQQVQVRPKKDRGEVITEEEVRERPKNKGKVSPEEEVQDRPKKKGEVSPEEEVRDRPKKKGKVSPEEEVRERPKKKGKVSPEEEVRDRPKKKGKVSPEGDVGERPKKKGKVSPEKEVRGRPKKKGKVSPEEKVREQPRDKGGEVTTSQDDDSDNCRDLEKTLGDHTGAPQMTKKCEDMSVEKNGSKKNKTPAVKETARGPHLVPEKKPATSKAQETKKFQPPEGPPGAAPQRASGVTEKEETWSSYDQEDRGRTSSPDSLIIKKPLLFSPTYNGHVAKGAAGRGAGRGRGTDSLPWMGRGFRGRGVSQPQNHFFYNYSSEKIKETHLNEEASNVSVMIQNPPVAVSKDYSTLPLLAAAPQPGKIIAFKLLELTENYTPEVSDYKEGRVLSYDAVSQELEVEVLSQQKKKEPGKFDLIYEGADGTDIVEYAVPQESKITQSWSSLIEPRLVTESEHPSCIAVSRPLMASVSPCS